MLEQGPATTEEVPMVRTIIQVIQVRMSDVQPGDVVNKDYESASGWFVAKDTQELHSGDIAVLADSDKDSINGGPYDLVGIQIAKQVNAPSVAA